MFELTPEEQLKQIQRGAVDMVSDKELLSKLKNSYKKNIPLRVKAGFDPTRPDLHIGHTVLINKMKQFQDLGHQVIFLIGDFTAMIGDPTGKNETRPPLEREEILQNAKTYAEQVFKILDQERTEVRYNSEWFDQFSASDMIRLAGQYTVARMLERDDFHKRYSGHKPIAIHEFLYPLVQGYDSVALKADVELGGTDQLFNLLVGRDLQKSWEQNEQCVLTVPILEGLDGVQKMSKSADNYIAVEDSPKEMFGKTMRVSDELMVKYYELLTDYTVEQLAQLKMEIASGKRHPRDAKVTLAKFLVTRFHSADAAKNAEEEFNRIFKGGGLPDEMPEKAMPATHEIWICQLLSDLGLSSSNSDARRLISGGAVEIIRGEQREKQHDSKAKLALSVGDEFIVKSGKKNFIRVKVY